MKSRIANTSSNAIQTPDSYKFICIDSYKNSWMINLNQLATANMGFLLQRRSGKRSMYIGSEIHLSNTTLGIGRKIDAVLLPPEE